MLIFLLWLNNCFMCSSNFYRCWKELTEQAQDYLPDTKVHPWLANGNLVSGGLPPFSDKSSLWCLNCFYKNMVYAEHLFSFWESELFIHNRLGRPCLSDQPPIQTLGTGHLTSFLSRHFTCVVTAHCWGVSNSCVTSWGMHSWKLAPGFALDFTPSAFSLC